VDVLEINPKVLEAARIFKPWNNGILEDPRAHIIVQDAKAHLLLSGRRYDVIISEPSNPWMAGLSELFTREFYARAKSALRPGGVMVQFIHSYKMDWETLCLVGRTFNSVFPGGALIRTLPDDRPVSGMSSDYLLVGFQGDVPLDLVDTPERRLQVSASRNVEISDPRILFRMVVAENLGEVFGTGPLHTDNNPRLEFQAPRLMFTYEGERIETEIARRARLSPATRAELARQKEDPGSRLAFAAYALSLRMPFPGMVDLSGFSEEQRQAYALRVENFCGQQVVGNFASFLGDREILERCSKSQMDALEKALKTTSFPAGIYMEMANVWLVNGAFQNAYRLLRAAAELAPGTPMADFALDQAARIQAAGQARPGQ
jgi:spermidine synthase